MNYKEWERVVPEVVKTTHIQAYRLGRIWTTCCAIFPFPMHSDRVLHLTFYVSRFTDHGSRIKETIHI